MVNGRKCASAGTRACQWVQGPVSGNEDVTVHTRARIGLECVSVDAKAFHLRIIGQVYVGNLPQAKKILEVQ